MNVKNIIFLISLLLLSLLLTSCQDNAPIYKPAVAIKFFPLKVGNYWVYQSNDIDTKYNEIPGTASIDSFVVVKEQEILGKMAYVILRFNNNLLIDTLFLAKENNQLFRLHNGETDSIPELRRVWLKIGDLDLNTWNIFANITSDNNYRFEGKEIIAQKHITINGTRLDSSKISFGNDSITLLPIIFKDDRKFYFDFYFGDDNIKSNIEIITLKTEKFWLKNDIGIYLWRFDPFSSITRSDSLNKYNPGVEIKFPGWERKLLRYKATE